MTILKQHDVVIGITGSTDIVVTAFLRIFLANKRLTDKQLKVTSAMVRRYSEYISNGVTEPYASQLLFSTETRKGIYKELNMGSAHLNNTFNALCDKGILVKDQGRYAINPVIVPSKKLTFKFEIDDKPRPARVENSERVGTTSTSSKSDSKQSVHASEKVDDN